MKRLISYIVFLVPLFGITGCVGLITSGFKEASLTPKQTLNIQDPLKVDKKRTAEIKKIAVPNLIDFARKQTTKVNEDDAKMHSIMVNNIISELRKSNRFELVLSSPFQKKAQELGLFENLLSISEDDIRTDAAKTGKELQCDAVLIFGSQTQKVDMGKAFFTGAFVGTIDVPVLYILELIDTTKGDLIYSQEQEAVFTGGKLGIKNTPDNDLKKILTPVTISLTNDFLAAFALPESTKSIAEAKIESPPPAVSIPVARSKPLPPPVPEVQSVIYLQIRSSCNLRSQPNTKSKIVCTLKKGEKVENTGKSGKWFSIKRTSGETGWVFQDLVTATETGTKEQQSKVSAKTKGSTQKQYQTERKDQPNNTPANTEEYTVSTKEQRQDVRDTPKISRKRMVNGDIIKLVKAGMSEDLILTVVTKSDTDFDTSTDGIIALSNAGVSQKIISAMITREKEGLKKGQKEEDKPDTDNMINPEGIIFLDNGQEKIMKYIIPEIRTEARAMGFGGVASYSVIKGDRAQLRTTNKTPSFLVSVPTNVQPNSYITLVSLEIRKNESREVVVGSGYMSYSVSIDPDRIASIKFDKMDDQSRAPKDFVLYKIITPNPLTAGEYALVVSKQVGSPNLLGQGTNPCYDLGVD